MDISLVTTMSGMVGSVVGVSAAISVALMKFKTLARRELLREDIRKRETLYGEFIGECAKLLMDAFQHSLEKPETLLTAYALVNRIRLCATPAVLGEAELLIVRITDQYFLDNLTIADLHELAHSVDTDPLKGFGEACRTELRAIQARA